MHSLQVIKRTNDEEVARLRAERIRELARAACVSLLEHNGASFALTTGKDMRGAGFYAVSIYKGREVIFDGTPNVSEVEDYIIANYDAAQYPLMPMLGLWRDGEKVYADISVCVPDRVTALQLAASNSQRAIFDLARGEVIPVLGAEDAIGA